MQEYRSYEIPLSLSFSRKPRGQALCANCSKRVTLITLIKRYKGTTTEQAEYRYGIISPEFD